MKPRLAGTAALKALFAATACALVLIASACGSSNNPAPDAGTPDSGSTLTDAGCYVDPQTSLQIINACTDAGYLDKHPVLPLLLPDGGLPPLP